MSESNKQIVPLGDALQIVINRFDSIKQDYEVLKLALDKTLYVQTGQKLEQLHFTVRPKKHNIDFHIIPEKNRRIFTGICSTEIPDQKGYHFDMDEIASLFPKYLARGGLIMVRHSSEHVGKCIAYDKAELNLGAEYGVKQCIIITGEIFKDSPSDDSVWYDIKARRLYGLSLGLIREEEKPVSLNEISLTSSSVNPYCVLTARSEAE